MPNEVIMIILCIGLPILALLILPIITLVKVARVQRTMNDFKNDVLSAIKKLQPQPEKSVQPEEITSVAIEKAPEVAPMEAAKPSPPPLPAQKPQEVKWDKPVPVAKKSQRIAPAQKSKLAESVNEILAKTWSWIVYGAEKRPEDVSTEYILASTWLPRAAIAAFVGCAVFFLKWSMERNLIPNFARVAIGVIFGISMLISGMKMMGKKYHVIGQCLLGGGLLVLYACVWAASPMLFGIISIVTALGLMIFVTVTAGYLSVRTNSLIIAIIGIIGAFLTPVLFKTEDQSLSALFAYMLMLNLGIFGIASYKQWRLLNYLGLLFTYSLFHITWRGPYDQDLHFPLAISFLAAVFVIHSAVVYIYNILKSKVSTTLEIIHLVANAAIASGFAYYLIRNACGKPYPAIMSISLAVFFIAHVLVFLKRKLIDRNLLIALLALAGTYTAWTLPLIFSKESLTISISLFALMLFWLSIKMKSNFLQNMAYISYLVVFWRMLALDMPRNFDFRPALADSMSLYWKDMLERLWTFGTSIASVITAFFFQRGKLKVSSTELDEGNDIPAFIQKNAAAQAFYWIAVFFIFIFLHLELNTMFAYCIPMKMPVLTMLWCGMGGYMLWHYTSESRDNTMMRTVMCLFLAFAFLKIFVFDLRSWSFCHSLYYNMEYTFLYAGMRFLDFGAILLAFFLTWRVLTGKPDDRKIAHAFGYGGLLLFFVYSSLETNSLLHWKAPDLQTGGISVLWALQAICFIAGGIWKNVKPLRYIGLVLFLVVIGKVFMLDLKDMEMIYRVIAFMVLGITLLLGAFAYIKSDNMFTKEEI